MLQCSHGGFLKVCVCWALSPLSLHDTQHTPLSSRHEETSYMGMSQVWLKTTIGDHSALPLSTSCRRCYSEPKERLSLLSLFNQEKKAKPNERWDFCSFYPFFLSTLLLFLSWSAEHNLCFALSLSILWSLDKKMDRIRKNKEMYKELKQENCSNRWKQKKIQNSERNCFNIW